MFTGSVGATCQWTCPTTGLHILRVLIDCVMLPDVYRISWSNKQWTCPTTGLHILRVLIDCVMLPDVYRISWSNMSMNMSNYRSSHTTCVNRLCNVAWCSQDQLEQHVNEMSSYKSLHTTCVNRMCVAWCSQDQLKQHVNEHVQLQVFTYYMC